MPRLIDASELLSQDTRNSLVGCWAKTLVRIRGKDRLAAQIVEVEAYDGEHDLACHASKGRTPRTEVMFGPAGTWYVYFVMACTIC